jgi:hypothetical protein
MGENNDLADSYNILNIRKNNFPQLLNFYNASDIRRIEVHTAEPLVPGPSCFDVKIAIATMKKHKSPSSNQILAELIGAIHKKGDKTVCNNYHGVLLLLTSYKILRNIRLSRFSPYIDKITGDHQCGFSHYRSTTYQIFCICQIVEKNRYKTKEYISYS